MLGWPVVDEPVQPRILIVDDDPVIRRLLQLNFRLEGFVVDVAARGDEALEMVGATPPDAIVLDVTMPDMDGWEVARQLRAVPASQTLPIVFLSARSRMQDVDQAASLGATYLAKPFDPGALVLMIREALEGASA